MEPGNGPQKINFQLRLQRHPRRVVWGISKSTPEYQPIPPKGKRIDTEMDTKRCYLSVRKHFFSNKLMKCKQYFFL